MQSYAAVFAQDYNPAPNPDTWLERAIAAPRRNYAQLTATGVGIDEWGSSFFDYDYAEFLSLKMPAGDYIQGGGPESINRVHPITERLLVYATYERDANGQWIYKPPFWFVSDGPRLTFNQAFKTLYLPMLLAVVGGGMYAAIGNAAFSAAGVAVSEATATAVGQIAVSTAISGGDIKSAVTSYLAGAAGGSVGMFAGDAVGSAAIGGAVSAATTATILGGDAKSAALSSLFQSGTGKLPELVQGLAAGSSEMFNTDDFGAAFPDANVAQEYDNFDFSNSFVEQTGGTKFDPGFFGPNGSNAKYSDAWGFTADQLGVPMVLKTGYHDPVYTENDIIDGNDTNYGVAAPSIGYPATTTGYHDPVYTESDAIDSNDTNYGVWTNPQSPLSPVVFPQASGAATNITPAMTTTGTGVDRGVSFGDVVGGLSTLALAALKVIPALKNLQLGDVVRAGTLNSAGQVITANNNGTLTGRNPITGVVTTSIPPMGVAYQTADGNVVTNIGSGRYRVVRPDGTSYTGTYTSGSLVGGSTASNWFSDPGNKPILYGALAVGAFLLLKGK